MAKIPSKIGKYEVVELIATGGMGAVYKAVHPTLGRNVIIKKLTLKDDQIIQRFTREAKIMMDFKNDNIVDVYDHFVENNSYYIVLEYVDGIALDALIKKEENPISNELALYIVFQIAQALLYAHEKGVVHRDIKPANILISKKGDIKLVDFGIAATEDVADEELTTVGMTLGTPSYMAPEQFENTKNVDKRADIYSLGVILYEMVTKEKPFPSGLSPSCIALIQKGKYKKPKKINKSISSKTSYYIKRLMHHKLSRRTKDLSKTITSLSRYFRKEKLQLYKERLAGAVTGTFVPDIPVRKNRFFIIPLTLVLLLTAGVYTFIDRGYQYEIIPSGSYGAVNINLKVDKDYYKEIDEIFIKSKLFRENGADLEFIEDSDYIFSASDNDKNYHIYTSEKIYLPVGYYRLKLMVDGNLFWRNFTVESRKEQRERGDKSGKIITLEHIESQPLPFHPLFTVRDQITGEQIGNGTRILMQVNGKFIPFDLGSRELKTGRVHYFQFSKKGYYTKDYILKISQDQTDLKLDAQLYPKPGTININGNNPDIKIRLNNSNEYVLGDRSNRVKELDKIGDGKNSLILNPGKYTISFTYRWNRIEKEVTVTSDSVVNLEINYNRDSKSFSITDK